VGAIPYPFSHRVTRTKCERKNSPIDGRLSGLRRDHRSRAGAEPIKSPATEAVAARMRGSFTSDAAAFFTVQESARFPGKCTTAVQFATASITSVFRKQSVVKDHISSAVKPVNQSQN
jgi:hypothetical protein